MKNPLVHHENESPSLWAIWLNVAIVGAVVAGLALFSIAQLDYGFDWRVLWDYRIKLLRGYGMTWVIAAFSLILSMVLGTVSALALQSRVITLQYAARAYVEGVRGTPFLVQIYFLYFIIATALGLHNKYVLGILILSIFTGAYVTEIIRGGIQSVPNSQWTTARSLGFSRWQTYRLIVFPQVFRRILPALAGQLSSLVKDSSLLSVIAVSEITMNALEVNAISFRSFETLSFLALGYLVITIPISLLSKSLERRFFYAS